MALTARQEYRQHSKSTLVRASALLFAERAGIVTREARKWKRRLILAAGLAFAAGVALGHFL